MLKRLFDILVAAGGLIGLLPLFLLLALAVRLKLGRPVFFRQQRPGKEGRLFTLIKFRTMLEQNDPGGNPLPDGERLTPFGCFLRSTSLDELPELWNVLKGEMSLVGPRPLLPEYLPRYSPFQARRHEVRPGITGWAQINGRNHQTWEERLTMEVWYVDNRSFSLDLKILFTTLLCILLRKGINAPGEATMSSFDPKPRE